MNEQPQQGGTQPPSKEQMTLLNALLLPDDEARMAANKWLASVDIDAIEQASMRLMPLFYVRLRELEIEHPLLPLMKGIKKRAWFLNNVLMRRAGEALRVLNAAGIEAMALKGSALTIAYYRDLSSRPMGDVDLMVRPEDAAAAISALCDAGWRIETGRLAVPLYLERARKYAHAINLVHPAGQNIDLHWSLLPYSNDADEKFWNTSRQSEIDGQPVRILSPAFELLHVVAHGAAWNEVSPIRWVTDARIVLRSSPEFDWDDFVSEVRKRRLSLVVGGGLDFLALHFGDDVPAKVLSELRESGATLFERFEYRQLRRPTTGVLGFVPRKLCKFKRITEGESVALASLALPEYLCWACNTEHVRQLPAVLARRIFRQMRNHDAA
ncbi:MAG: nucleotidyltransferase family protein [Acidobacteriota bacterium]